MLLFHSERSAGLSFITSQLIVFISWEVSTILASRRWSMGVSVRSNHNNVINKHTILLMECNVKVAREIGDQEPEDKI